MNLFDNSQSLALDAAQQSLLTARTRDAVINMVRQTARNVCGADGITIVLREGDLCHYVEEDAIAPLWKGLRFEMGACISGWAMRNGQTVVIEDVMADPRVPRDIYRPTFVRSLIITPVGDNPVAALGAYWRDKRSFSAAQIKAVKTYSGLFGDALSRMLKAD